jgi:plastocyanin
MRAVVALLAITSLAAQRPLPADAGTVRGLVEVLEKKGKRAKDVDEVVVWVEGPKVRPEPANATMTMRNKAFEPHVVVVPVGGAVAFPNADPILHNAFSLSGDNRFDLDLYKKPTSRSVTFEHSGIVRVYCNIHPQMSALVVVLDTPFWARPDANGRFSIAGVPPGDWVVKAWHERAGEVEHRVFVSETGETGLDLSLDASSYKRARHKNKYGKDYKQGRY